MKKLLFGGMLALAASCVLVSCAQDEMADEPMNEMKEVTLTTRLDAQTRSSVLDEEMELFYTVYNSIDGSVVEKDTAGLQLVSLDGNSSVTLTLQLEQSKSYDIAFWAQPKGTDCYDITDMKAIKICYDRCRGNDSHRIAFYGNLFDLRAVQQSEVTVSLKSPFGKLEVLTTVDDIDAATSIGFWGSEMKSFVTVSGVADTFNALYGKAEGENVNVSLLPGVVPVEVRTIDGEDYRVLTSDYLLTSNQEFIGVKVTLFQSQIDEEPIVFAAGRALINKGETAVLANRYITRPIDFGITINGDYSGDVNL